MKVSTSTSAPGGVRVWVFDTVSGRLRADFGVPDTARVVSVGEGRVAIDLRPARDEPGATERGALSRFTFEGETSWRFVLDEGCRPPKSSRSAVTC
ncbi:hypothetical protein [Actinomadura madurae]|uniref:hypothetical protein n=1 Tax=Actinomadura madurae TaxID=1993 RepID=UPI0020D2197D|nr:hypothetical protein [Actinomadura madurae]MCP9980249.1 hypothetical protein [Actinomadura madurae]